MVQFFLLVFCLQYYNYLMKQKQKPLANNKSNISSCFYDEKSNNRTTRFSLKFPKFQERQFSVWIPFEINLTKDVLLIRQDRLKYGVHPEWQHRFCVFCWCQIRNYCSFKLYIGPNLSPVCDENNGLSFS